MNTGAASIIHLTGIVRERYERYIFCGNSLEKTKMKGNKILSAMSATKIKTDAKACH